MGKMYLKQKPVLWLSTIRRAINKGLKSFFEQPNNKQQHQSPNDGRGNDAQQTTSKIHVQHRAEKPAAYECTENAYDNVAQQPKAVALADLPRQPTRGCADEERENQVISTHNEKKFW